MLSQMTPVKRGGGRKAAALLGAGLIVFSSLSAVVALAVPQKTKKPASKPAAKSTAKPGAKTAAPSIAEQIALGKKIYANNGCAGCHAIAGKGGNTGPELTNTGAKPEHTIKWLADHVTNPKMHTPTSAMPAFGGTIKGSNLTALATYLKSLGGKPEADATSGSAGTSGTTNASMTTVKVAPPDPAIVAKIEKAGGSVRE